MRRMGIFSTRANAEVVLSWGNRRDRFEAREV
jgi:hypothetical protein